MDHADFSVKLLFDEGLIKDFCSKEEWYPIIKFAIANHNKFAIADCDDDRILKHAKLIRDTDKLDILYLIGTLHELNIIPYDTDISEEVINFFKKHISVKHQDVKTKNDFYSIKLAYPFDVNNDIVFEEKKKNLEPFQKALEGNKKFECILNESIKYIDKKINKMKKKEEILC